MLLKNPRWKGNGVKGEGLIQPHVTPSVYWGLGPNPRPPRARAGGRAQTPEGGALSSRFFQGQEPGLPMCWARPNGGPPLEGITWQAYVMASSCSAESNPVSVTEPGRERA